MVHYHQEEQWPLLSIISTYSHDSDMLWGYSYKLHTVDYSGTIGFQQIFLLL